jgi:SAM-dependent methyltransferase
MIDDYVLGRSAEEYERLRAQARMWEPATARLLDDAGLAPGARCLDVGCGPGETMRLMAERGGRVTGIDADGELGLQALDALAGAGHACTFERVDVEASRPIPGGPYDLVLARLLLIHVDDPVAVLRRLWDCVAPGGCLIVQDYDLMSGDVVPVLDVAEEFTRVARGAFLHAGRDARIGLRLPALHVDAGIGAPDGIEAGVRIGTLAELAPMYEAVYRSTLPAAIAFGLTTEEDAERWLEAFAHESARAECHAALWPLLIGTWKRRRR